jgi:hypothetical protein
MLGMIRFINGSQQWQDAEKVCQRHRLWRAKRETRKKGAT